MKTKPSVLPSGMRLVGDVKGTDDFVIFGKLEGEVEVDGTVVVEVGASVRGTVYGQRVVVRGAVIGDVGAEDSIRVEAEGQMVGDLEAPRVNIIKGARFKGQVHMQGRLGAPAASRMDDSDVIASPRKAQSSSRSGRRTSRMRALQGGGHRGRVASPDAEPGMARESESKGRRPRRPDTMAEVPASTEDTKSESTPPSKRRRRRRGPVDAFRTSAEALVPTVAGDAAATEAQARRDDTAQQQGASTSSEDSLFPAIGRMRGKRRGASHRL